MNSTSQFNNVLEAVERLSDDEQGTLIEIVRHRLAARARTRIAAEIQEAHREFAAGNLKVMSVEELMNEIKS